MKKPGLLLTTYDSGQKMKVIGVTPILNVTNLLESFAWFEKVGWEKGWDFGDPPTFGAVISGKAEIFLCQNCQGARGGPMPQAPWDNQAGSTWMSWWLESPAVVDVFYEHALKLGIVAPFPPMSRANSHHAVSRF